MPLKITNFTKELEVEEINQRGSGACGARVMNCDVFTGTAGAWMCVYLPPKPY